MKKSNYLSERLERLLKGDIRRSKITQIRIKRGYKRAFQLIEDDIAKYVTRISDDLKLDSKALKRKIPKEELYARAKELKLEEETMANYENLSYAEAIRREMVKNVESMAKENESLIFENLFKTYEHNYYSTSYLLYRTMDDFSFTKRVTREYFDWMAKKPWTSDGKTFSDRIWKDQKTLVDELYKEFTVSATRGANLKEAARRMSRKMDVSYKKCLRLLNTEDSFFSNKAVMDAYQNTTAEEYMILATLDRKTCEICGDQDTKHYMIKDAKVGVNMPPFHPNCRCTTVVYFGDEEDMPEERMMRDENGKSVKTEYMSYDEWKKKYVDKIDEIGYNISEEAEKVYDNIPYEKINEFFNSQKNYVDWINNLSEEDKEAVFIYTTSEYKPINQILRKGADKFIQETWEAFDFDKEELPFIQKRANDLMEKIDGIRSALSKFKTEKSFKTYRCTTTKEIDYYKDLKVGQLSSIDDGFMSSSLSETAAEDFYDHSTPFGKDYKFVITVPSGYQNGAYISELSDISEEKEFLFNNDSMFKVINIELIEGVTNVILEAVK